MEKEYYIVALNDNKSRNPMKLDNIIYKGEEYNLPSIFLGSIKESVFDSVEVLATKGMCSLRDVITGEVMFSSPNGICNGLSYYKIIKASQSDIIRITNKYKNMSKDDIERYKNTIEDIKNRSIKKYNEYTESILKTEKEEKEAREYLSYIQEFGI